MNMEKMLQDGTLKQKLAAAKNLEEAAKIFTENGVEVTVKDIEAALDQTLGGELDENSLEDVSGGAKISNRWRFLLPLLPLIPVPILPIRFRK